MFRRDDVHTERGTGTFFARAEHFRALRKSSRDHHRDTSFCKSKPIARTWTADANLMISLGGPRAREINHGRNNCHRTCERIYVMYVARTKKCKRELLRLRCSRNRTRPEDILSRILFRRMAYLHKLSRYEINKQKNIIQEDFDRSLIALKYYELVGIKKKIFLRTDKS